jgi:hypothetical protein
LTKEKDKRSNDSMIQIWEKKHKTYSSVACKMGSAMAIIGYQYMTVCRKPSAALQNW